MRGWCRFSTILSDARVKVAFARKGSKCLYSSWQHSRQQAFEYLERKLKLSKPHAAAMSQEPLRTTNQQTSVNVATAHQIYGLYRDGKDMSPVFKQSASSWQAYCCREKCRYTLWTADQVDTLMQTYAPPPILALYRKVRYAVLRVDIARFVILYWYGGLYADLDVFQTVQVTHK